MPFPDTRFIGLNTARTAAALLALLAGTGHAADVVVRINGLAAPLGQIGCFLFTNANGFPMDGASARVQWLAADSSGTTCRFSDVKEGSYAVSIGHDVNGNKRVDTNLIGLPTEQWGVSNNIRPNLRAPRFEEASFSVASEAKDVVIDIKVAK